MSTRARVRRWLAAALLTGAASATAVPISQNVARTAAAVGLPEAGDASRNAAAVTSSRDVARTAATVGLPEAGDASRNGAAVTSSRDVARTAAAATPVPVTAGGGTAGTGAALRAEARTRASLRALADARAQRAAADSVRVPAGLGVASAPVWRSGGAAMVGVNDLARLLGASKFWRPDVRKLVLRAGEHRLTFTVDNPFVLLDDRTVRLEHMVIMRAGELQVPVEIARLLPQDGSWPRLAYDPDSRQLRVAPAAGFVGAPRVETRGALTLLVVPSEHAAAAEVMNQSRARFRLRVAGGLAGALPDSLPDDALVRDLRVTASAGGVLFELALDPAVEGWRLERDPVAGRVTLTFARISHGYQPFATEGVSGPRTLRTVVIDAGHGGADPGTQQDDLEEKSLTLELARLVAEELQRRSSARVVITRRDDRELSQDARAEVANRSRADAVLSLHFETFTDPRARGTHAWCAPARPAGGANPGAGLITLLPWRDIALTRAVESRGLAESVTAALERAGLGPAHVRERLPLALIGVQSPGILLECGTLSNPEDRALLLAPGGLKTLAAAIAMGVLAWQRNE